MQVIWSRTAQAKSSGCYRSCLHTATHLARRATTAASKNRIRLNDVFTACYSTILATAAVADMKLKDQRIREWDRVIAEAKAGIPTYEDSPDPREFEPMGDSSNSNFAPRSRSQERFSTYSPMPIVDKSKKLLEPDPDASDEYTEEDEDPELFPRDPQRILHMEWLETTTARLVDQLLTESRILSAQDYPKSANPSIQKELEQMRDLIESLMDGASNLPLYEWRDLSEVSDQREALHRAIQKLCQKAAADDRPSINLMLAKVSYNLLVCKAPPSTTTYNVLLAELIRLKQPHIAQTVINSFLHDTRLKPTKLTAKLLLDHYQNKGKGDVHGFRSVTKRLSCTRGKTTSIFRLSRIRSSHPDFNMNVRNRPDMLIRHRHVDYLGRHDVKEWAYSTKTIHRNGHLHQKMPRDIAVHNSLILGSLKLKGVQAAVRHVRTSYREGHIVHTETLVTVITACLEQLNFTSGLNLIRNFLSLWEAGVGFIATIYSEQLIQSFLQLLAMCGFDTALSSARDLPIKSHSWETLQEWLHFMYIESLTTAVDRFSQLLLSLNESLGLKMDGTTEPTCQQEQIWLNYSSGAYLAHEATDSAYKAEEDIQGTPDIDLALHIIDSHIAEQDSREALRRRIDTTNLSKRVALLDKLVNQRLAKVNAIIEPIEKELFWLRYARVHRRYQRKITQRASQNLDFYSKLIRLDRFVLQAVSHRMRMKEIALKSRLVALLEKQVDQRLAQVAAIERDVAEELVALLEEQVDRKSVQAAAAKEELITRLCEKMSSTEKLQFESLTTNLDAKSKILLLDRLNLRDKVHLATSRRSVFLQKLLKLSSARMIHIDEELLSLMYGGLSRQRKEWFCEISGKLDNFNKLSLLAQLSMRESLSLKRKVEPETKYTMLWPTRSLGEREEAEERARVEYIMTPEKKRSTPRRAIKSKFVAKKRIPVTNITLLDTVAAEAPRLAAAAGS
ncbi:hypothetical protein B2J93_1321 [Marssonina coronariae]|uniref:Uncharacterized protein n=1 Tax=Diplocarpon coronariae TaxID=2795749 RepID=A0A218YYI2_9HELO|nr:hypothetical protein B2J93_1321 [Marssonina coronariae]